MAEKYNIKNVENKDVNERSVRSVKELQEAISGSIKQMIERISDNIKVEDGRELINRRISSMPSTVKVEPIPNSDLSGGIVVTDYKVYGDKISVYFLSGEFIISKMYILDAKEGFVPLEKMIDSNKSGQSFKKEIKISEVYIDEGGRMVKLEAWELGEAVNVLALRTQFARGERDLFNSYHFFNENVLPLLAKIAGESRQLYEWAFGHKEMFEGKNKVDGSGIAQIIVSYGGRVENYNYAVDAFTRGFIAQVLRESGIEERDIYKLVTLKLNEVVEYLKKLAAEKKEIKEDFGGKVRQ